MSFRYRKSISLGMGTRLNISKTGIGISGGIPGARASVHSSGRRTTSVGIPGTGMYFRKDTRIGSQPKSKREASSQVSLQPRVEASAIALLKAPMFAPKYEKCFITGVKLALEGDCAAAVPVLAEAIEHAKGTVISPNFFLGYCHARLDQNAEAADEFSQVVASDIALPDQLMLKYRIQGHLPLMITPSLVVTVPFSTIGAALLLTELYQTLGQMDKAVGVLEALVHAGVQDPIINSSLAELYTLMQHWDEAIEITDKMQNTNDITCQALIFRARAFSATGLFDAALESLKDALRSKKRAAQLLLTARYDRAAIYTTIGKTAQARKDLELIMAEDSTFRDVNNQLIKLTKLPA
jgi:tetratricopeptide (TPR) repeat protein